MNSETQRYLDLIGEHLRERRASVLVGAGFSRNAVKVDERAEPSPDWNQLGEIFIQKLLTDDLEENQLLKRQSPLELAGRVESAFGRPELDRLLLNSIRDADFLPSGLHRKLLKLHWSDIFTTNYDTLLERTANDRSEQPFTVVTCQEDLIGSSNVTRIIKLHGSFPSQRPFIITSEDYRTYPRKFAPFVNTVQQSMLENTLCLIGFSGDDPNFDKWIGWVRDNLGGENAPYIYLLRHTPPSEEERRRLYPKRIIPVDLSTLAPSQDAYAIYDAALDYLLDKQREKSPDAWDLGGFFSQFVECGPVLEKEHLALLKALRQAYPGWLTVPEGKLELLKSIYSEAVRPLAQHCSQDISPSALELEYLYELDWLREKTLLPPFASKLHIIRRILERHPEPSALKCAIQLSLLRCFRESGEWDQWEAVFDLLKETTALLSADQLHQLRWEECLQLQARYQYQKLKWQLSAWNTEPGKPAWVLRRAGLLAECGELEAARAILKEAILDLRSRTARRDRVNLSLLSLESAMMVLQDHITKAMEYETRDSAARRDEIDDRRGQLHDQYHVDWERQNEALAVPMEGPWTPFQMNQEEPSFDFGCVQKSTHFGDDKEVLRAYRFLRFREETGTPFCIRNVSNGNKAACGAAERLARYAPFLSILTAVRADEPKTVKRILTRSVLSVWTQEEADEASQFYIDAVFRTEPELPTGNQAFQENFPRLAAEVLPELLSLLCVKCSSAMLERLLDLAKHLYSSEKRTNYTGASSLARRLIACWPPEGRRELAIQLLSFPLFENSILMHEFPDPLSCVPIHRDDMKQRPEQSLPEIGTLLTQCLDTAAPFSSLNRLLRCFCLGLLTPEQKLALRELVWDGGAIKLPAGWPRTILLDLPAPDGADVPRLLAKLCSEDASHLEGGTLRPAVDRTLLQELKVLVLELPAIFTEEQISLILSGTCKRLDGLTKHLSAADDIMGCRSYAWNQMYEIAHILWLLTANHTSWRPNEADAACMQKILEIWERVGGRHCGLYCAWNQLLGTDTDQTQELISCLYSMDEPQTKWGVETLALNILRPQLGLLDHTTVRVCIDIMAPQIVWGTPKLLPTALQAVKLAVEHMPEALSDDALGAVLTGLSRLERQTRIGIDDTIEEANQKGSIRQNAAALARAMHKAGLHSSKPEILERWLAIVNDPNEFAEIRIAGSLTE